MPVHLKVSNEPILFVGDRRHRATRCFNFSVTV